MGARLTFDDDSEGEVISLGRGVSWLDRWASRQISLYSCPSDGVCSPFASRRLDSGLGGVGVRPSSSLKRDRQPLEQGLALTSVALSPGEEDLAWLTFALRVRCRPGFRSFSGDTTPLEDGASLAKGSLKK